MTTAQESREGFLACAALFQRIRVTLRCGPSDVEGRIGLTGGHIVEGDCLPDQTGDRRFGPRTTVPRPSPCGAATRPGGSVIGVNGRNAARAVLADLADVTLSDNGG